MNIEIGIGTVSVFALMLGALQYLLGLLISERLKSTLQKEHSRYLEEIKWEQTVRTQAIRISEYLSKAAFTDSMQTPEDFQKARQISWELAMLLPSDLYRVTVQGIANREPGKGGPTILDAIIGARGILLGKDAGDLTADEIAIHGPGFGRFQT